MLKLEKSEKIAIVGMGVNNRHLGEYLRARGIKFEVIDGWSSPEDLVGKLDDFELIFRTPGLPYLSRAIQQAKTKGVKIYSQTKLFFDLCPCPIIGVTGTKGKGTTATLISKILEVEALRQAQGRKVYLSGNIGQDPFEFIEKIKPDDLVVLELSSFQLQDLEKSPHIAVVLEIFSEHLDHHKDIQEYYQAKHSIVRYQTSADLAVINYDNEIARGFAKLTKGKVIWSSCEEEVKPGCCVSGEKIILHGTETPPPPSLAKEGVKEEFLEIMPIAEVKLLGRFNLQNVTAAIAAAVAAGVSDLKSIRKIISEFNGLPHRLEFIREVDGVKFYNDSASTTPETAIAALSAFSSSVILIAGGSEKNSNYTGLAQAISAGQVKVLIPIGATGPKIAQLALQQRFAGKILDRKVSNMSEIVTAAHRSAKSGDIILLSPASASFDMFTDYQHRGELFKKFVRKL